MNRTELLVGSEAMARLRAARVIVFGVGGVGSWCAESLVRSGIGHLTVVDSDRVCVTNINRQSMATTRTVGRVKVDALRDRLLEINPYADITALQEIFSTETADSFHLEEFDYVIDCIDSLKDKLELILRCTRKDENGKSEDENAADAGLPQREKPRFPTSNYQFYSSMGAALKMDPTKVRVSEFWKVDGCPLAAVLRRRMRKMKRFPQRKFQCVWSPEVLPNLGEQVRSCGTAACMCPKAERGEGRQDLLNHEWCTSKAQINGSLAHITAIYGFTLAGLVMQDIYSRELTL